MAKKIDAKKLAPKTWKTAEDTLKQSHISIESFPRDKVRVAKAGRDALRACQHVYFVTKEVLAIQEIDEDEFENLVLDIENKLNRISLGLNHGDVRYMSLYDQSVALSGAAEDLNSNLNQYLPKKHQTKDQEEIIAEATEIAIDKSIPEEIPAVVVDKGLDVAESSENVLVEGIVSEPQEPETDLPETIVVGTENEDASIGAITTDGQGIEEADTMPDESIIKKQGSQIEADESTASDVRVLEDNGQVSETEEDVNAATVETGQLSENDQAADSLAEVQESEAKAIEAENDIAAGAGDEILPSAKQEAEVSDTPNQVGS